MLDNNTISKLHEMRLSVMAQSFDEQIKNGCFAEMSFEERFGMIVDSEWSARKSNRLTRLIQKANYSIPDACIENIEYHPDRKLDKTQIARLSTCAYIEENHNLRILGATGSGKTYIACALGMAASRNFYSVRYVRLPELFAELAIARGDGTYRKVIKQYKCETRFFRATGSQYREPLARGDQSQRRGAESHRSKHKYKEPPELRRRRLFVFNQLNVWKYCL